MNLVGTITCAFCKSIIPASLMGTHLLVVHGYSEPPKEQPSQGQKGECGCYPIHPFNCHCDCHLSQSDEVEKMIDYMADDWGCPKSISHDLVRLARKEK